MAAILLHPNFIALTGAEGGTTFLGLPVTSFDYSSSLIPAILTAYAMSWIERGVDKITPAFTKNFLKPMLISNVGIAGSCLAVWLKSKNSETKQLGFSSGVSAALAGVTEPGLVNTPAVVGGVLPHRLNTENIRLSQHLYQSRRDLCVSHSQVLNAAVHIVFSLPGVVGDQFSAQFCFTSPSAATFYKKFTCLGRRK